MQKSDKQNIPVHGLVYKSKIKYGSDWKSRLAIGASHARPLHVLSAALQLLFGKLVVAVALLGFITPIWIAAVVNVVGCAVVVVGGYQLYDAFTQRSVHASLVQEAMRNAIDCRN